MNGSLYQSLCQVGDSAEQDDLDYMSGAIPHGKTWNILSKWIDRGDSMASKDCLLKRRNEQSSQRLYNDF